MPPITIKRDGNMLSFDVGDPIDGTSHIGEVSKIKDPDWQLFGYNWTFFWGGHAPTGYGTAPTEELALSDCEAYGLRSIRRMQEGK